MSKYDNLRSAYKKERDLRVAKRMLAVHMVCVRGMTAKESADMLMQCPTWVSKWVKRFEEAGIDGLRDLPRSGKPRAVPKKEIDDIMADMVDAGRVTPASMQQAIRAETGVEYHIAYVRKMMRQYGLTPKTADRIHINHASDLDVYDWQQYWHRRILRLIRNGFVIGVQDEALFVHDTKKGSKYWSPVGDRIYLSYTGSHTRFAMFGTITNDGRQMFRTHKTFDSYTFILYLEDLQKKFGKIAIILDKASPHTSAEVQEWLRWNRNIRLIFLPTGSPQLNAVEACWNQGKRKLLVSEHYATFKDMWKTVSEYYRTTRFGLNIYTYLYRTATR